MLLYALKKGRGWCTFPLKGGRNDHYKTEVTGKFDGCCLTRDFKGVEAESLRSKNSIIVVFDVKLKSIIE